MSETIRVQGIDELITTVPFMLGFQPRQSIVLVLVGDGKVSGVGRCDLTDLERAAELFAPFIKMGQPEVIQILIYSDDRAAGIEDAIATHVAIDLSTDYCDVREPMVVCDDGWSYVYEAGGLGDDRGIVHPFSTKVQAELVYKGMGAVESRDAMMAASFEREGVERITEDQVSDFSDMGRVGGMALFVQLLEQARETGVTAELAAALLGCSTQPQCRDGFWTMLSRDSAEALFTVWIDVYHRAPEGVFAEYALALAAVCAWQTSTGARLTEALKRLDAIGACGPIAQIVRQIHSLALPPSALGEIVAMLDEGGEE
jgi:hypothetical protein